jgi:voltage-gated potassium channel
MTQNKIIIFSYNEISHQIAQILQKKGYDILIAEEDKTLQAQIKQNGFKVSELSLMEDENLEKIGLSDPCVKAFFCLNEDKNKNLFIILSVRHFNKHIKIISLSSDVDNNKPLILAGANKVLNPYEISAFRIFRILHKPYIMDVLDNILFSKSDISIEEITVKKDSIFDGILLSELNQIKRGNIIILGIQDKELSEEFIFFSAGINHKIDEGDTLVLLGHLKELAKFKESIDHII